MNENNANFTPAAPNFKTLVRMSFQGLTNFPYIEEDFDALTNYGLLSKVVEYLNTVISNNNEQNTLMTNLYNAYVSLQDYVNNYFDNLDVQEEINNKLDKMAEDGTLTQLIKNYVDPIYEGFQNQINNEVNDIKSQVDGLASGSPLVASSTSEMTDTSKVYVNTTDGKWYYYDGDSWEIGGVYQATGISDNSVTPPNTTFLTRNNKGNLIYFKDGEYAGVNMTLSSDGKITAVGTATGTKQEKTFMSIYLASGTYWLHATNNATLGRIFDSTYTTNIFTLNQYNAKINIPYSGIYHFTFDAITNINYEGYVYFSTIPYIDKCNTNPSFNNEYLLLKEENFDKEYNDKIKYPIKLYSSKSITGNFENKDITNRTASTFITDTNLRLQTDFIRKIVFYSSGPDSLNVKFYLVTRNNDSTYSTIYTGDLQLISSIKKYTADINLDISEYEEVYIITRNIAYALSNEEDPHQFTQVTFANDVWTKQSSTFPKGNIFVEVYGTDGESLEEIKERLQDQLNKFSYRDINPVYEKNVYNVIDTDFYYQDIQFTYNNSTISNHKLYCIGNTYTEFNKSYAIDYNETLITFEYIEDCNLGIYDGDLLGLVDMTNGTINICYPFTKTDNTLPTKETTQNIPFTFEVGNKYTLKLVKNAMNYEFILVDMETMTEVKTTKLHLANHALGSSGIKTYSGSCNIINYKYNTLLFPYAKVVFIGDSTTEGVGVENNTNSRWCYQLATDYFNNNAIICGVGGSTATQGYGHFANLINEGYKFDYAIVYLGLNDIRSDNLTNYYTAISNINTLCENNNIKPIYCTTWMLTNHETTSATLRDYLLEQGYDLIRFDLTNITDLHPNESKQSTLIDMAEKCLNIIIPK